MNNVSKIITKNSCSNNNNAVFHHYGGSTRCINSQKKGTIGKRKSLNGSLYAPSRERIMFSDKKVASHASKNKVTKLSTIQKKRKRTAAAADFVDNDESVEEVSLSESVSSSLKVVEADASILVGDDYEGDDDSDDNGNNGKHYNAPKTDNETKNFHRRKIPVRVSSRARNVSYADLSESDANDSDNDSSGSDENEKTMGTFTSNEGTKEGSAEKYFDRRHLVNEQLPSDPICVLQSSALSSGKKSSVKSKAPKGACASSPEATKKFPLHSPRRPRLASPKSPRSDQRRRRKINWNNDDDSKFIIIE